ncbi:MULTISPECIES: hypothetical protein [Streptomyces]|uniref:Uncharacterized protein n=1 Tax=Streptomyces silvae TaxID=2803812 RepID=A0ABU8A4K2_9ACTN|nr:MULTISPECIES: hypothetical protein [unclassified Streptomyces]WSS63237.1 hypothetical protein OG284_19400 [Streptomyces sp. NBC_01177]WSS77234.1 hypothetical protein OG414_19300 [Streptomyces sp. NBC_01174]MDX3328542.1 hypothetical protein [Streptomyces sp. ME02-6979-3A]MDX3433844.1 hypothetical protein [Streptomyces sp. ME01-18a]MDX3688656.1 hypothetical protein [Streptomyces sp. AK04-4c]
MGEDATRAAGATTERPGRPEPIGARSRRSGEGATALAANWIMW